LLINTLLVTHAFYYDEIKKCFPQVTIDQELLEIFSKHVEKKIIRMTIAYTDPTDAMPIPKCYTQENSDVLDIHAPYLWLVHHLLQQASPMSQYAANILSQK
jgi:hypothetical protein